MIGPGASVQAMIELTAGCFYPITVEVQHLDRVGGRLRLEWTTPYGVRFAIPQALLFMPTEHRAEARECETLTPEMPSPPSIQKALSN